MIRTINVLVYGTYRDGLMNSPMIHKFGEYNGTIKIRGFQMYKIDREGFPRVERTYSDDDVIVCDKVTVPDLIFQRMHKLEKSFAYYLDTVVVNGELYFIWLSYPHRYVGNFSYIAGGDWKVYVEEKIHVEVI